MGVWIFHGLTAVALVTLAGGTGCRLGLWGRRWQQGAEAPPGAVRSALATLGSGRAWRGVVIDGLLFRRLWRVSAGRWLLHAALAWSFLGLFFIGSLGDMATALGLPLDRDDVWFAALNDALGLLLLAAAVLALTLRGAARRPVPAAVFDDIFVLLLLAFLAVGGFLLEAARYLASSGKVSGSGPAFVGQFVAALLAPLSWPWGGIEEGLWWTHALVALGLVAYIPFSKLFHILAAPAAVAANAAGSGARAVEPFSAPAAAVGGRGAPAPSTARPWLSGHEILELEACVRCGECLRACSSFAVRGDEAVALAGMIRRRRGLAPSPWPLTALAGRRQDGEAWGDLQAGVFSCTLCGRCEEFCPLGLRTRSLAITLRQELARGRCLMPANLEAVRTAVTEEGNVFDFPNEDRALWAEFLDELPPGLLEKESAEVLYFVGCVSSFSPAVQEIPQAFLQVLLRAGMDVAVLAGRERCCGFPLIVGGLGDEAGRLAEHNLRELRRLGARLVVFNCPSCYYTWKRYYPLPEGVRLAHASEVISDLLREGRLVFEGPAPPVAYHDPCDLGRGLGVYDPPREVVRGFAGGSYRELTPGRGEALCCGGGGDVEMWDPDLVGDVNRLLIEAVEASGARLLVQGCPQCKRITRRGLEGTSASVETIDISELALRFGTVVDPALTGRSCGSTRETADREVRQGNEPGEGEPASWRR